MLVYFGCGGDEMYLDERSTALLLEIIKNPNLSNEFLKDKYNLSLRQVEYSLDKINEWLEYNQTPSILYQDGRYWIDDGIYRLLDYRYPTQTKLYVASKEERQAIIPLYILLRKEILSLEHLSQQLNVSKNTIISDIKEANVELQNFSCEILYSRLEGYFLSGDEWNKRKILLSSIHKLSSTGGTLNLLKEVVGEEDFRIYRIQRMLERIEKETNQNFIDARLKTLPFEIESFLQRIEKGKYVELESFISFDDLFGTREYDFISEFLYKEGIKKEEEKLFLTLHLLTVNRSPNDFARDDQDVLLGLYEAIEQSLVLFEKNAVLELKDKEELLDTLMLHLKPAYYRIKYNLTTQYQFPKKIEQEVPALQYLVSRSLEPLRSFFDRDIPEHEETFITLYIGSHLIKSQKVTLNQNTNTAIIVCPNGVTISNIVYNTLETLFPEINFYGTMSIREYEETVVEHDVVFSTTPLVPKENTSIYIVNKVMSDTEKTRLRERVMREIFYYPYQELDLDRLMDKISESADIKDEVKLLNDLRSIIYSNQETFSFHENVLDEIHLNDLLREEFILYTEKKLDWHEIISLASSPLLRSGKIEQRYVEKMQKMFPDVGEHIVLNRNIAIPHAGIDDGVNDLGMSLLVLEEPYITDDFSIQYVVVIATPNKKVHFNALMELMELSGNPILLRAIYQAKNRSKAQRLIEGFVKDGEVYEH